MSKKAAPPVPTMGKKGGKGTPPPFIKKGNDGDADDKKPTKKTGSQMCGPCKKSGAKSCSH